MDRKLQKPPEGSVRHNNPACDLQYKLIAVELTLLVGLLALPERTLCVQPVGVLLEQRAGLNFPRI